MEKKIKAANDDSKSNIQSIEKLHLTKKIQQIKRFFC